MLVIGIICLVVAAISYFKYLSEKNGQANQKQAENKNEAKWQRTLAPRFRNFINWLLDCIALKKT